MSNLRICAIVDRAPQVLPDRARLIGPGPYLVVEDAEALRDDLVLTRLALLRQLGREVACLPCRIDAVVADDREAVAWLARRAASVASALGRVDARVEFDLHVTLAARAEPVGAGAGTRHLDALAARYGGLDAAATDAIIAAVRSEAPSVVEASVDPAGSFVAFLVRDAEVFARETAHLALGPHLPEGATLRWSGPWPAFTFAAEWLREETP